MLMGSLLGSLLVFLRQSKFYRPPGHLAGHVIPGAFNYLKVRRGDFRYHAVVVAYPHSGLHHVPLAGRVYDKGLVRFIKKGDVVPSTNLEKLHGTSPFAAQPNVRFIKKGDVVPSTNLELDLAMGGVQKEFILFYLST
uniref:Uncharacterized protein n=2 Tax=Escherichia coli TaxID=562 RepID=A0A0A1E2N0_ECOLX|nr:hypothetical protein [Escherichia coli]